MREVYQENAKELARLGAEWKKLIADPIAMLNMTAEKTRQPIIVAPK